MGRASFDQAIEKDRSWLCKGNKGEGNLNHFQTMIYQFKKNSGIVYPILIYLNNVPIQIKNNLGTLVEKK